MTAEFVAAVADYSRAHSIDLVVPTFEETFALAARRGELPEGTGLFAAPFKTLARLHDKASFEALARRLGMLTPATTIATDADGLRAAAERLPRFIAKPAFSRAGTAIVTNVGPRAGERSIEEANPSEARPWLVQEFIDGDDLACLAVAREGRLAAYAVYEEPLQGDGGYAMRQVAIDARPTLGIVTEIAEAVGMHGFFGLDYRMSDRGPCLIECNARCSPGALLLEDDELTDAILGEPPAEPLLIEPGRAAQFDDAVLSESLHGIRSIPHAIEELLATPGAFLDPHDPRGDLFGWLRFRADSRMPPGSRSATPSRSSATSAGTGSHSPEASQARSRDAISPAAASDSWAMKACPAPANSSTRAPGKRSASSSALPAGMTTSSAPAAIRTGATSASPSENGVGAAHHSAIARSSAARAAGSSLACASATRSPSSRSTPGATSGGKITERVREARSRGVPEWSTRRPQSAGSARIAPGPPGSVESSASPSTRPGARATRRWAMKPPIEKPRTVTRSISSASSTASRSAAIESIVTSAGSPSSEAPIPRLSGISSENERPSASTKPGSQSSALPA
jgi:glutathione synthase/RimK-type ligase-like ATP-grasp enzyme